MILRNLKVKKRAYFHPLGAIDLPDPIDPSDLPELVLRFKQGDLGLRHILIEGHIKLAMDIVARYHGRTHNTPDELVSAALFGVCQAVDWAPSRLYDENITPYIVATIHRFISDHIERNHLVQIPREVYKNTDRIIPFPEDYEMVQHESDDEFVTVDTVTPITYDDTHPMVIEEIYQGLGLTDFEKILLKLRFEGNTDVAISAELDVTKAWVGQVFKRIQIKAERLL